jgi:hypothetical protein
MRFVTILVLALIAAAAFGQVTVTGTVPANASTSVGLNSFLSITFSAPMDTTMSFSSGNEFLTNADSVTALWWSADRRSFNAAAVLKPNKAYFMLVMSAHPLGGGSLPVPYVTHWSTGITFPSNLYSVSGSVTSGASGVSPANAIVAISENSVMAGGNPRFLAGDVADGSGNFTIPYVPSLLGYPIAAKDANGDGQIDPSKGDVIAQGNPFTPTGNVTGLNLTFVSFKPLTWIPARDSALAFAASNLPANRELRQAYCWDIDTAGTSSDWEFVYTIPGNPTPSIVRADVTGAGFDSNFQNWNWIYQCKTMPSMATAAIADSMIAKAERAGGKAFRRQKPADSSLVNRISLSLGDLHQTNYWQLISDTTNFYWGAEYRYERRVTQDSGYIVAQKLFLGEWATGNILGTTGVGDNPSSSAPVKFTLDQNFPNPFNPSTTIRFGLPNRSNVSLVVYNTLGQQVAQIVNGDQEAGYHDVRFDASGLSSGVYFYRLTVSPLAGRDLGTQDRDRQAGGFSQTRKLLLIR